MSYTTQELKEMFSEVSKQMIVNIHNTYKTFHNMHVPYDIIKKEWRKAEIKVGRKNAVLSSFGNKESVYLSDVAKEITHVVTNRLDKKYKIKTA